MMSKDEALKMAINALYVADAIAVEYTGVELERIKPAINACKEALESQEPLSDDEILTQFFRTMGAEGGYTALKFARAIEQAHGIGVKDALVD